MADDGLTPWLLIIPAVGLALMVWGEVPREERTLGAFVGLASALAIAAVFVVLMVLGIRARFGGW